MISVSPIIRDRPGRLPTLMLRTAAADPSVKEISVLAHSMGTWLTMETLRQMAIRDGRLPAKLHDVVLASPDIDGDVFRKQIARIGWPRPRISVFVSRDDRALDVSRLIGGDVDRLGAIDPDAEPWKSTLEKENVHVFDLTDVSTPDRLRHGKLDRKSTRLNSSHIPLSRMPSSA